MSPSTTRAALLRTTARLAGAAVATSVSLPAFAQAAPVGDDLSYLQFAAVAEFTSIALADALAKVRHLGVDDHKVIRAIRAENAAASGQLTAVLGADAPLSYDFTIVFPKKLLRTRASALAGAARLERTLYRTALSGLADVQDPASRVLLGQLAAVAARHETVLLALGRGAHPLAAAPFPTPLSLEAAGTVIDAYLAP
jgi:hypothetical protein